MILVLLRLYTGSFTSVLLLNRFSFIPHIRSCFLHFLHVLNHPSFLLRCPSKQLNFFHFFHFLENSSGNFSNLPVDLAHLQSIYNRWPFKVNSIQDGCHNVHFSDSKLKLVVGVVEHHPRHKLSEC